MKVSLLNVAEARYMTSDGNTEDYEYTVKQAAAICVDKLHNVTDNGMMTALNSGHLSILEHLPLTFLIEDVSRALTHQLVRHRIASYSQMSQRYAKVKIGDRWFVIPESFDKAGLVGRYIHLMNEVADFYQEACEVKDEHGNRIIPNEDARFVLPNACFTSIIVTMNARAFVEAGQKRICNKAQWEIRAMFREMRNLIKDIYPTVYSMTKPNCQKNGCTEVKSCGNPYKG